MNLEQVAHFTAHPHELTFGDAPALKILADNYPYSSVYSLLYLTSLSNGKSPELDVALKQHAYRLTDRTKLYHLLTGAAADQTGPAENASPLPEAELKEVKPEPKTVEAAVSSPLPEEKSTEESIPQPAAIEAREASLPEETALRAETAETVTEMAAQPEEQTPEVPAELVERAVEAAAPPTEQPLTFERTEETIVVFEEPEEDDVVIEPEWEKIPAEASPSEGITTVLPEHAEAFDELTEAFTREQHFEVTEEQAPEEVRREEEAAAEQPESVQEVKPAVEKAAENSEQTPRAATRKSFTSWLNSGQSVTGMSNEPVKKPVVNELIDNFIEKEPSITRAKTDFYSPSKKAKESLNEDAVPVSETLAKIYAAQGNYPKAIHVYHQLMLSFPEKKSLFAVQIEELKKNITP